MMNRFIRNLCDIRNRARSRMNMGLRDKALQQKCGKDQRCGKTAA
jgi:hypothetical protein